MKRLSLVIAVIVATGAVAAQQQPILWSAKQLADLQTKIRSNVDQERHLGLERMIEGGATLIYRDGSSEAEVHTKLADFITVRSGEGEVLIGGTIVDGRSTAADELRGKGIQGATSYKVSAGDILYIPANTVHQFVLAPGRSFVVTIVKITPPVLQQGAAPTPRAGTVPPASTVAPRNDLPQPYRTTRDWGELPAGMKWPAVTAVEPAPDGSIYVVQRCFDNSCAGRSEPPILKYNRDGRLLSTFGQNMFNFPHGATVDRDGNLWVTDARGGNGKGHQVFKFSPTGKVLMTLGKAGVSGSGPDLFDQPTDVVVAPNGDIFVTDSHRGAADRPSLNNRVVKFTRDGRFVKEWGRKGSGPGEMSEPHTIAMDSRGRLFVGDRENNRIQIFDQEGRFLDEWRQFGRPSGIFITADDTIYVADSESGPDTGARELPGIRKGIRIGSARDGSVTAFIEDLESTRDEHSGAEGVGVDAQGNVYGAVVRRQMLERHVRK